MFLFEAFAALFIVSDEDGSGDVDLDEFLTCLDNLGKGSDVVTREQAQLMMDECDIDGSGTINAEEFSMIMVNHFCKTDQPKGILVEKQSNKPWKIPDKGICTINVIYDAEVPTKPNLIPT